MSDILLITPPLTQLNTPYPATIFLKGYFNTQGISCAQFDLGIETINSIFTSKVLSNWFERAGSQKINKELKRMLSLKNEYINWVEPVKEYLQGKCPSLAHQLSKDVLPHGARYEQMADTEWLFGEMGVEDKAKYLSTLFLEDIADFIQACIDEHFGFSRYAEHIGIKAYSFQEVQAEADRETAFTELMFGLLHQKLEDENPDMVAISIPFHGNMLAAFQCSKSIKKNFPHIKVVIGGGWVNTELRQISDAELFNWVDYVCLDDGEVPLSRLWENISRKNETELVRTFTLENGSIKYYEGTTNCNVEHKDTGTPCYEGIPLNKYISVLEVANPMHRLWSDGRWNKFMVAHGCYWAGCSFCDTSLDYIKRYSQADACTLVDRMEAIMAQTGERGFHFVDEAAPPHILKAMALEIISRGLKVHWWANIRFEKAFSKGLCQLLAKAGCIAVSGGLEVASDRLLHLMNKGVTVEQVAGVCKHFQDAGIMIHAYLMYGFPTETAQETVDALEVVRQLFEQDLLQSAYWHRFAMTVHSPVGKHPEQYNVQRHNLPENAFAQNDVEHTDPSGAEHEQFSFGLKKALYNYMHGQCIDFQLQEWFDFNIPFPLVPPNRIKKALRQEKKQSTFSDKQQVYWFEPLPRTLKAKKGMNRLVFDTMQGEESVLLSEQEGQFVDLIIKQASENTEKNFSVAALKEEANALPGFSFNKFIKSSNWELLQQLGLVVV